MADFTRTTLRFMDALGVQQASLVGNHSGAALKKQNFKWDEAMLQAWLERPGALVPGTSMAFEGLPAEADRKAIIVCLPAQP